MKLRTKLALSVTAFTTLLLLLSFIVVTLVVRSHLIESRYTQLEQAEELMEDDSSVRALLTLHEDSVVLSNEDGRWVISNDEDGDDSSTVNGDVQASDLPVFRVRMIHSSLAIGSVSSIRIKLICSKMRASMIRSRHSS